MSTSTNVTREGFLSPAPRRVKAVTLTDGRQAYIRSLNELEHSQYEASVWQKTDDGSVEMDPDQMQAQRRRLVALCLCDADGDSLLTATDVDQLGLLDGGMMRSLVQDCRVHCGLVDKSEDPGKN